MALTRTRTGWQEPAPTHCPAGHPLVRTRILHVGEPDEERHEGVEPEERRQGLGPRCAFQAAWGQAVAIRSRTAVYLGPVDWNRGCGGMVAARFHLRRFGRVRVVHCCLDALEVVVAVEAQQRFAVTQRLEGNVEVDGHL